MAKRVPIITSVAYERMVLKSTLRKEDRHTLLVLKHSMFPDTLKIVASYQRLANDLALSRRQTITRIRALEDLEVLNKIREGGGRYESGGGRVNVWILDLDALDSFGLPPVPKTSPRPEKRADAGSGEADFTPKGEVQTREGCSGPHKGVKPTAHNPINQTLPNNLANHPPENPAGVALGKMQEVEPIKPPTPKAPRFARPPKGPEERRAELRALAALSEDRNQAAPIGLVQFPQEGGV